MIGTEIRTTTKGMEANAELHFMGFTLGSGVNRKDFRELNSRVKPEVDLDINLGRGRIYPRCSSNGSGTFAYNYTYGHELKREERSLAPFEVDEKLQIGFFTGLKGVFFLGLKGKLYLLDRSEKRIDIIVPDRTRPDSAMPNILQAKYYALPTATVPNYRKI